MSEFSALFDISFKKTLPIKTSPLSAFLEEEEEKEKPKYSGFSAFLESTPAVPSSTRIPPTTRGTLKAWEPSLWEKGLGEARGIVRAGARDIGEMAKGIPKAVVQLADLLQETPEPERSEMLGKLFTSVAKEELKEYGKILKHPIRTFREHPGFTTARILPAAGAFRLAGALGAGRKLTQVTAKVPLLKKGLLRPFSTKPELQTRFREYRGEVGLGQLRGREAAQALYAETPAERFRLGQVMTGGITTKPEALRITEPIKGLREKLAGELRKRGLLAEETFLTKLPKKRVAQLEYTRKSLQDKLKFFEDAQTEKLPSKTKMLNMVKKWAVEKDKHNATLRRLRSEMRWKDVEMDMQIVQQTIDQTNGAIKFAQDLIKKKKPTNLAEKIAQTQKSLEAVEGRLHAHYHRGAGGVSGFPLEYMPREYMYHIENKAQILNWINPKKYRLRTPWKKGRKDIPFEERVAMGEIFEPSYPMYNAITRESRAIATYDLFQDLAKNPKFVWDGTGELPKGWVQITKTEKMPTLGDLAGKYVHPDVADEINRMGRILSDPQKIYQKALGIWKWGKVVPRMGTHMRNIYNNLIFADFAGLSPFDPTTYAWLFKAIKAYRAKGTPYTELLEGGLIGTEYYGAEILPTFTKYLKPRGGKTNLLDDISDVAGSAFNKLGEIYQAEDQVFKLAIYMKNRGKGMSKAEALTQVDKWMPNYIDVPGVTRALRQSPMGAPFFSFKSEAIRIAANASKEHPLKLAFWMMLPGAITDLSAKAMHLTDEQTDKLMAELPGYARTGMHALVPSNKENPRWMDLTYVMFLGDLVESADPLTFMANPVYTTTYAIATRASQGEAKELYSDRSITRPGMTTEEEVGAWLKHMWTQMAPNTPFVPGSYDYEKIRQTLLKKRHPYRGDIPSTKWELLNLLGGIRTKTFGTPEQMEKSYQIDYYKQIQNLKDEMLRLQGTMPNLTRKEQEDARNKIERLRNEIEKLKEKMWNPGR